MATFDDLALYGNCPVINTQRKDEATLIATRVPLDDVRLARWGWVLALGHKDGRADQDDIETLQDKAGRQYPKIYQLADMKNYIEKWGCIEWEEGYQKNGNQVTSVNGSGYSNDEVIREEVLQQIFSEYQGRQEEQVAVLQSELKAQLMANRNEIGMDNVKFYETLQEQIIEYFNRLIEHSRTTHEDTQKQLEALAQEINKQSLKVFDSVETRSLDIREEVKKFAESIKVEIENQTSIAQRNMLEALEIQFHTALETNQKLLDSARDGIKILVSDYSLELQDLKEQVKLVLQALDPEIEEDSEKTENTDAASTTTKMARKVTTQIERITLGHQKMSMNYFHSANEQSRQGFHLAWLFGFIGLGLLCFTIVAAVFMAILHLYGYTVLIGAIGGIGTTIITFMSTLSSLQARTAQQFAIAQKLLDRSYRPTIANAMCIGYSDEGRKQQAIDKIIEGLLKDDGAVKDAI